MKRKTAALYDPYLDIMGGGERHILSILQALELEGYEISIYWDKNVSADIRTRLNLQFKHLTFLPNIFSFPSPIQKIQKLSSFDVFFYVTDGSYFFSSAKKNFVFCMVPNKKLYQMSLLNRIKTSNYKFISNSSYTKEWMKKWGVNSEVVYPYVSQELLDIDLAHTEKEKIILSVGRFFPHLHAKKHEEIIEAFGKFYEKHPDFRLVLAGGVKNEDMGYFKSLENIASKHKNIVLKPNIAHEELVQLYRTSMFFWHFAGYGVDEEKNPDRVEHLGMTPLEAMAAGSIPFCYRAGGPKEIIQEGKNGYLFLTVFELLEKMERLLTDPQQCQPMKIAARQLIKNKFSYEAFKERVADTILT